MSEKKFELSEESRRKLQHPQGEWSETPVDHPDHADVLIRAQESEGADWRPSEEQQQEAIEKGDAEEVLAEWRGESEEAA